MGFIYVGGTTGTYNGANSTLTVSLTSLTGGISSSPSEGDLVVVGWGGTSTVNFTKSISGWTNVFDLYADDTRDANLFAAYKIMTATPDTSIVVPGGFGTASSMGVCVQVWRNVHGTDTTAGTATSTTAIDTGRPDAPAITTTAADALIIVIGAGTDDTAVTALTAPTGSSNFLSASLAGSTYGINVGMASVVLSSVQTYNPATFGGGSTTTSDSYCAATLAFRLAPPSAGFNSLLMFVG